MIYLPAVIANIEITALQAAASLVLIVAVLAISWWQKLELHASIVWATVRASAQLLAVGALFTVIFESAQAAVFAGLWVFVMVAIASAVVMRRVKNTPGMAFISAASLGLAVIVVLAVIFGLQIVELTPVSAVVIAGITIGNTMPAVVQAVDRTRSQLAEQIGEIEAMLALGFTARPATRKVTKEVSKLALVPQIEKTKVVGLISLPGAMTGLLLAGVDPIEAVLIQLVVMFMVLGSVAVSVVTVTMGLTARAITTDLRISDWVKPQLIKT